jgi:hypothetical protein
VQPCRWATWNASSEGGHAEHEGAPRDGAGARWRLRSSLTHLEVRSLRCSDAAFAGTVRRRDPRSQRVSFMTGNEVDIATTSAPDRAR